MAQSYPFGNISYVDCDPFVSGQGYDPIYTGTSDPGIWNSSGNALLGGMSGSSPSAEPYLQSPGSYFKVTPNARHAGGEVRTIQDERHSDLFVQGDPFLTPNSPYLNSVDSTSVDSIIAQGTQQLLLPTLTSAFVSSMPEPREMGTSSPVLHPNGGLSEPMHWMPSHRTQEVLNSQIHWPDNSDTMVNTYRSHRSQGKRPLLHHSIDGFSTIGSLPPSGLGPGDAYSLSFTSGLGDAPLTVSNSYPSRFKSIPFEAVNLETAPIKTYPSLLEYNGSSIHRTKRFYQLSNLNADPWNPQRPFFQLQDGESEDLVYRSRPKMPIPPSSTMPWKSCCKERDKKQPDQSTCAPRTKRPRQLTKEQREHASKVRKLGACKSCRDAKVKVGTPSKQQPM